ncbi:hypothetical protein QBC33DRAFT_33906 [Phialemonium atrogriseum]|uniref:Calponin-homology (CH) domain-containing protein n=1 Tax=Phialemonium atrogriseum TaxID=1093897 RepID=A0AAJ0CA23_9PEZI|nr:uncharacterized protein QBC33DRAFT_33906 [Phialemonium atrogriseum]KAK1772925.1 hypothetical protein QBC33DRAFT_33906 [Phialemonium atrogriseum]
MSLSKGAQAALLKWVNTFEGLDRRADSLDDLKDGVILGQVLQILNSDFNRSSLNPNATSWLEKKRNLEIVYRSLAQFLRQENPYLAPSPNQFRTIVDNPDANGMCEFLSAFVSAACLGGLAASHVPAIMKMDRPDQREIMAIIQRKQIQIEDAQKRAETNGDLDDATPDSAYDDVYALQHPSRDPDLEKEAEVARLRKDLDTVKKQNADLLTRNEQLQMSREEVVQDLQISQREVDVLRKTNESDASAIIRKLEQEKREEVHLIDTLQAQVEDDRLERIRLRNELEHFKNKAEQAKDLEDRVKELEHERDNLNSRLKQAEWYKKSAEQAKITDQKNRELESQNHELREQVQEFDKLKADNEIMHHTCQQYRKQMGTYESEKFEDQAIKASLKEENETLKLEKQVLADQLRIGEDQIKDLQERMQVGILLQPPASPGGNGASSNLERELETTSTDPAIRYRLEISRLEAENKLLKNNMGVAADNERLRSEVDFEKQKHKAIEDMYADANNKYVLAQEQIKVLLSNMKGERDQSYEEKKTKLADTIAELDRHRAKIQKLESELADRNRELLAAQTDLNAVGQQSIDALEVLKSSDQLISASLRTELESTREKIKLREIDLEQLRQQLTNALISKDHLRQQLDDAGITGIQLKPRSQSPVSVAASEADAQKPKKDDSEKTEKYKAALKQKVQQLEKAELDKYELQRRIKAAEGGSGFTAQKAQYESTIKDLKRENAMITTAWYDLTSRLQSNHVVLQRRHDVPKSWLNRQRQMVNATPRR